MIKRIRSMIDTLFCDMKMTAENLALRDELMANAMARYEDVLAQGKTEEEAFASVAASLEDVSDLLSEMSGEAPQAAAKEPEHVKESAQEEAAPEESAQEERAADSTAIPQTDLGDALNKAFTTLGNWGQSLMPQAKKFARQMDDATGGMLSDLGRAVNKGMQDAQKAAGEVLDKYQADKSQKETPASCGKTPVDLREEAKDLRAQAGLKRAVGSEADAQALEDQADLLDAQAEALAQAIAMEEAASAAQNNSFYDEIYGADDALNEEAFARSVEDMSREAEELLRGSTAVPQKNELRFPILGLRCIDAKLDADNVFIEPTDEDEVIVRWSAKDEANAPDVSFSQHTLTIRRKNPDVFKTFFSVFSKNGETITILLPRGCSADYTLATTSGAIRLTGLDVDNVSVSTTSGDVRVEPDRLLRASAIKVDTISGNVTVSAMAQKINAKSISGDVFISCDAVSVEGDVVSGKLHIEGACDTWNANAVSGSTELVCTAAPMGKINVDTISGGASIYLPATVRGFAVTFESMSGTLINEFGADHFGTRALPIHLNTISGSMRIARL